MSTKTQNWREEDFRRELKKLDMRVKEEQGIELAGSELEISFTKAKRVLGSYHPKEVKFSFSLAFFNSNVPESCAIDVIRHEYAHYYAHAVYGSLRGHDKNFKIACRIVGANPETYYSHSFEKKEKLKESKAAHVYHSRFFAGKHIKHPVFGIGIIVSIKESRNSAFLTIDFPERGIKTVDEIWFLKNGGTLAE